MADNEIGFRWWLRFVVVPIVGGGGIVAIIVALLSRPDPTGKPTPGPTLPIQQSTPGATQTPSSTPVDPPRPELPADFTAKPTPGLTSTSSQHPTAGTTPISSPTPVVPHPTPVDPLKALTSRDWTVRIMYGKNEDPNQPTKYDSDDVTFEFAPGVKGYSVWRMERGKAVGVPADVKITKGERRGQLKLSFTRDDLGDLGSRVDCKRTYPGHGATFDWTFNSTNATLGGPIKVAKPDGNRLPYKCAEAQLLPTAPKVGH